MSRRRSQRRSESGLHDVRHRSTCSLVTIMKTIAIILLASSMCLAIENSLKPKGTPVPFTITGDYTIQIPPQPTGPEKKAAADLQHWLREIGGIEHPIASSGKVIRIFTNPEFADEQYQIE